MLVENQTNKRFHWNCIVCQSAKKNQLQIQELRGINLSNAEPDSSEPAEKKQLSQLMPAEILNNGNHLIQIRCASGTKWRNLGLPAAAQLCCPCKVNAACLPQIAWFATTCAMASQQQRSMARSHPLPSHAAVPAKTGNATDFWKQHTLQLFTRSGNGKSDRIARRKIRLRKACSTMAEDMENKLR